MRWKFPIGRSGKPQATPSETVQRAASSQPKKRSKNAKPRWWEARRAQNTKPSTYTCPLCHQLLPSLSDHMLLFPEGDHSRRRHAHTACVMNARQAGRLPTREEWLASQK